MAGDAIVALLAVGRQARAAVLSATGCSRSLDLSILLTHWGALQPLRHVRVLEHDADGRLRRSARVAWEFWSADWTPWPALVRLRQDWPGLRFDIRPHYEDGTGG